MQNNRHSIIKEKIPKLSKKLTILNINSNNIYNQIITIQKKIYIKFFKKNVK